ncbi:MAG: hypothetical protein KF749_15960, partial [Bacteroidetes bacterium]|nr:hypothetical protein [Bacteroidota bacterium]
MKKAHALFIFSVLVLVLLAPVTTGWGQFTNGNIVILRVGDGSGALSSNATAAFLDEYTTTGTLVQTVVIPSSGPGRVTLSGSATSEGGMTRSTNGQYLFFTGYDRDAGTAGVTTAYADTLNRVVARVDAMEVINATTRLTDAFNGSNIRSAVSTNGTDIWVTGNGGSGQGTSAGTRYTTLGSTTTTGLHTTTTNMRWVNVFNGQLYTSSATGANLGVNTVGTGLPTTDGQIVTLLPGLPTTGTHSNYGFAISPDGNTMYMADDGTVANGGGIQKWTLSAGTWSLAYILLNNGTTTTSIRGLIVDWSGANPVIYANTSTSVLIQVIDTGAASTATTLATAAASTAFRGIAFAPVAGSSAAVKTINNTIPTGGDNYNSFTDAITALNAGPVPTGGIIFNVSAGQTFTENPPEITASGTSADQIVFQKSGAGANPKIVPLTPGTVASSTTIGNHGDGIVIINGGDYITFDGVDLQTDPTFTGVGMIEYGYYLKKFSGDDACKNVTIKNCTITLNKAAIYSFGVGVTNISGTTNVTVTSTGGRSENIKIYGNTISNAYGAVLLRGFAHTTAPYEFFDNGNEVGAPSNGNSISDFAGGTTIAYAVYGIYQDSVSVRNNTITGGSGGTGTVYGVFFGAGINTDVTIDGNTMSLTNEGTTSQVACISLQTGSTTGTTNTQTVTNNTLSVNRTGTTTGTIYFFYATSNYPQNLVIENNNMGNSSSPGTGAVYGIYQISNPVNLRIRNNIIRNIASNSGSLYGINLSSVTTAQNTEISGNLIDSLVTGGTSGTATGINVQTGIAYRIFNNTIRNIVTTGTTTTATAFGITRLGTSDSTFIFNNYISDIRAENSIATHAIAGINVTATTTTSYIGVFYNTIFLNAASTSTTNFGTSGIFMNTGPISDLRNNVVVNLSTPGPTGGGTVAYRRSSATLTSYAAESNNNDFYVNTAAGERRYFYGEGTTAGVANADSSLAAYKARVAPRDAFSIAENPPFINAATPPYNLHINHSIITQLESGGTPVASPIAVTDDFDGDIRNATTPDIGADEFAGMGADLTPPSILYTELDDVPSGTVQVLAAAISDPSGVPTTGIGLPVLYWKINSGGTYTGATGTFVSGNDFTFSFGAGTVAGDTVYYFIAAQDSVNNVGVFPSFGAGGFTANPPAASTPPTNPSSYRVLGTIAAGTYTVGTTGGTYSSLKAAFDAINGAVLAGNVTLSILNEGTTEPASAELDPVRYGAGGPFTITVKPAASANPVVSGDFAGFLLKFNGADNVMIDGSNSGGSSRDLTLASITQSTNSGVIWVASLGPNAGAENITIKNTKIVGGRNDTTNIMGVYAAGQTITSAGTGAHNNNLVIDNNLFERLRFGVYTRGVATTGIQTGLVISNNLIGSEVAGSEVSYRGIEIGNTDSAMVEGNTIFNVIQATNLAVTGIHLDVNVSNATIAGNTIRKLHSQFAGTAAGAVGINFNTATGSTNNLVANNMISDLRSNGGGTSTLSNPYGIRIAGGTNHKIYYNSVSLTGSFFGTGTTNLSSAFIVTVSTATGLDIRNNIFSNSLTGEGTSKAYAIYAVSTATTFGTIDYNDYYVSGPNGVLARQGTTDVPDLAGWRTFTGQDLNSVNGDPFFVNAASDLHIDPTQPSVAGNAGTPIAAITVDIDGDTRNATTPDIGADEYTPGTPGLVLFEDFESGVFPPVGWST